MDADKIKESVRRATTDLVANSKILKKEKEEELPHFDLPEIEKGKRLGAGAFGIVWEISNVALDPAIDREESGKCVSDTPTGGDDDDDDDEAGDLAALSQEARRFIAKTAVREDTSASRYAVKILRPELSNDPSTFEKGCIDLAMEANFLSNFVHPNIIKVRGAGLDKLIGTKDYFLVMDRLYGTLDGKLEEWKATQKKMGMFGKKAAKEDLLKDRLNVAFELSAALNYMHARNIIYRDLKPENLGFDIRGDVKIFDLGFARELTPALAAGMDEYGEDTYKLTGKTGTLIYMAPEVVLMKPYGLKADVYSLSILLWEFFHLGKEPFGKSTTRIHEKMVCRGSIRPKIDKKVPKEVAALMTDCWAKQTNNRPGMKAVNLKLKREMQALQGDGENGGNVDFSKRRSTFVFRGKK